MAVVISEFEVVPDAPPAAPNAPAQEMPPPPQLTPRDLERLMRHKVERALRVWAH
jgi:hypothetical protein